jgi:dTMP kinase
VHDVLRPALDAGEVVITDRFVDSSLAYQGAGRTIPLDEIRTLSRWATQGLVPDLTILLDLPPEVGLARARGRAVADRLESESLEFHQRVRQAFIALAEAEPDRYLVVDARHTADEIAAQIRQRVTELLSGLPLQTLAKTHAAEAERPAEQPAGATVAPREDGDRDAPAAPPHHPHAQTGATPQLHP